MLGRDELYSLVQQCVEILERARTELKRSPRALEVVLHAVDTFKKYLDDLKMAELKQETQAAENGRCVHHTL